MVRIRPLACRGLAVRFNDASQEIRLVLWHRGSALFRSLRVQSGHRFRMVFL